MEFSELLTHQHTPKGLERIAGLTIIGIDPGETTGICTFREGRLIHCAQLDTKSVPEGACRIEGYLSSRLPVLHGSCCQIVMESYRVYSWKTKTHAWAGLHTPRLIGAVEYIAHTSGYPLLTQGAGEGKAFCTDDKLKEWGMYQVAHRHANDAIRHVCHFLLFGGLK